ncbi:kinase [Luteimonas sp. MJ204]|uniref:kinase n=1 Tax=Luteimonas sp. MJ145 TaxID=3129234 RepID=UPI0031BA9DF4
MHRSTPGFDSRLVSATLDDALRQGARILGISGLQGSGKSTFAAQLAAQARSRGLQCAVLSIDDVYLGHADRQRLAREVHPLLATRGPPGTHEVALAIDVLDALRAGRGAALPRFDKLADDRLPRARWPVAARAVDLVVFEGWFLGTPAEDDAALVAPLNALERDEDADGRWRRWCNHALARDYPALWQLIDRLLLLLPPSFGVVPEWRWQAEQGLRDASGDASAGMDRAGVERFVQHYERTSRQALRTLPGIADHVITLDARRRPTAAATALSRPRS